MSDTLWRVMLICRGPLSVCSLVSHLSGWGDSGFHESRGVMRTNGLLWRSKGQEHLPSYQNKADFTLCGRCGKFFGVFPSGESSSFSSSVAKIWSSPGSLLPWPFSKQRSYSVYYYFLQVSLSARWEGGSGAPPLPWLFRFGAGLCQENHSLLCQKYSSPPCHAFYTCSSFLSCYFNLPTHIIPVYFLFRKFRGGKSDLLIAPYCFQCCHRYFSC